LYQYLLTLQFPIALEIIVRALPNILNVFNFKILYYEITLLFTFLSLQQKITIKRNKKMEKNMVFTASNETINNMQRSGNTVMMAANKALNGVKMPIEWLRKYYSVVCEKELTFGQTMLLINAQVAFIATVFPANMPIVARIACCAWLVYSLKTCKNEI
jgi:hypothetical protein